MLFATAEAVDALVYYGLAGTRKEAIHLGRQIATEQNLFHHATGDHAFSDDYLFYRFKDRGDIDVSDLSVGQDVPGELGIRADRLKAFVDVRDRTYRMVKYQSCFVGAEAVDEILFAGLTQTRQEAVILGRTLASELRLFSHVTGSHQFKDEYLFYRFRDEEDLSGGRKSVRSGCSDGTETGSYVECLAKAERFKECVEVKDRKYRITTYKQCFVGCGKCFLFSFSKLMAYDISHHSMPGTLRNRCC